MSARLISHRVHCIGVLRDSMPARRGMAVRERSWMSMERLSRAELAVVAERKLTAYLLATEHWAQRREG